MNIGRSSCSLQRNHGKRVRRTITRVLLRKHIPEAVTRRDLAQQPTINKLKTRAASRKHHKIQNSTGPTSTSEDKAFGLCRMHYSATSSLQGYTSTSTNSTTFRPLLAS